jgi:hypothetical protein
MVPIVGLIDVFVNRAESDKQVLLNVNADVGASKALTATFATFEHPSMVVVTKVTL